MCPSCTLTPAQRGLVATIIEIHMAVSQLWMWDDCPTRGKVAVGVTSLLLRQRDHLTLTTGIYTARLVTYYETHSYVTCRFMKIEILDAKL